MQSGKEQKVDHFWNGRHVFVTGATGIIGSWLVKDLLVGHLICL